MRDKGRYGALLSTGGKIIDLQFPNKTMRETIAYFCDRCLNSQGDGCVLKQTKMKMNKNP